jgi:hypothetical protein
MLRSIRPKRAISPALTRSIASCAAVGIARGGRAECAPGIELTGGLSEPSLLLREPGPDHLPEVSLALFL